MKFIANVIWFIFGGLASFLIYAILGLALCLTIIGIPFGLQCFKIGELMLAPFGKEVVYGGKGGSFFMNMIWLILFGWELALFSFLLGIVYCITIIGIPAGIQVMKLTKLVLMPFGTEVHKKSKTPKDPKDSKTTETSSDAPESPEPTHPTEPTQPTTPTPSSESAEPTPVAQSSESAEPTPVAQSSEPTGSTQPTVPVQASTLSQEFESFQSPEPPKPITYQTAAAAVAVESVSVSTSPQPAPAPVTPAQTTPAEQSTSSQPDTKPKTSTPIIIGIVFAIVALLGVGGFVVLQFIGGTTMKYVDGPGGLPTNHTVAKLSVPSTEDIDSVCADYNGELQLISESSFSSESTNTMSSYTCILYNGLEPFGSIMITKANQDFAIILAEETASQTNQYQNATLHDFVDYILAPQVMAEQITYEAVVDTPDYYRAIITPSDMVSTSFLNDTVEAAAYKNILVQIDADLGTANDILSSLNLYR